VTTSRPSTTLLGPIDALRIEEIRRTRTVLRIGWIVAIVVAVSVAIAPGDRRIELALLAALGVAVAGSVWMYARLATPSNYSTASMNVLAIAAVLCGQLGICYVGAFSAAPTMVALGLYFFCRTESLPSAIAIYVLAAGSHAVESALVIGDVIEDPGFYPVGSNATVQAQIAGQLLLQASYGMVFWLARVTRKTALDALRQLQRATRLAAQREVQLVELRRDLDRAFEVGGPGRFTGVIVGSWELGVVIGRGAMGEVYAANDLTTRAEAAVKLLRRELLADPRHVERFVREVRIASAIESPNVVRVLEAATLHDALPYLAMERLTGQTLSSLLRKGDILGHRLLASMVASIGGVLELARAAGIVHRDIKPQNLFLTSDEVWKLLDFGVALLADGTGTLTRGGAVGTPAYMAPEQARGLAVDHRADVYALGAVLYRCVTGVPPFSRPDTSSLLYSVVEEMPMQPSTLAPVSPAMEGVLRIALAKDRDQRFATARELVVAFEDAMKNGLVTEPLARRMSGLPKWSKPGPGGVS
jgi:eukaryotic-like serine/threonine-protein kinase